MRARPEDWSPVPPDEVLFIVELEGVRRRGLWAFTDGLPLEANPYGRSNGPAADKLRSQWVAGWRDGERLKQRAQPIDRARLFLRDRYSEYAVAARAYP